jgi:superfamily II DNA/RNA helicase
VRQAPTSCVVLTSWQPWAILISRDGAATLVFARTDRGDDLAEALSGRGRDAAALHGGLAQEQRD